MWLSPKRQVWAYQLDKSSYFCDAGKRVKYEHHGGDTPITKLPLGEDDAERVLPFGALALGEQVITPWLFGEKILRQDRREVFEDGRKWIEFHLVLWRGEKSQATLRVDAETHLPVRLLLTSPKDATKTSKWEFDYPAEGPLDIYALGVPEDTKIDDLMPVDSAQQALHAIAASRDRIGDFRMFVVPTPGFTSYAVWRKGDCWRVECCFPDARPGVWPSSE